jgi:hypothetical protein
MAGIISPQTQAALTANGGTDGFVTVADNSLFPIGARVYISSNTQASRLCVVAEWQGTTKVGLRFINSEKDPPQFGVKNSMAAFLLADTATLSKPYQVIDEYWRFQTR